MVVVVCDVYKGGAGPVLVLSSDSYSNEEISVDISGPSSHSTLYYLLTTCNDLKLELRLQLRQRLEEG